MLSRLNVASEIKEKCNSNNLFVYNFHLSSAFSISGICVNLEILFFVSIFNFSPLSHNYFSQIQMESHSHILPIFSFMIFLYFPLLFFYSFFSEGVEVGGGKRGTKIGFFQNGKVEQVSFKYGRRKHDFRRIEDLSFLDWFWKF